MLYFPNPESKPDRVLSRMLVLLGAFLVAMCLLLTYSAVNAQAQRLEMKFLQPGDSFPELTISNVIGHKSSTIQLNGVNDKLIVLIFFGTWCSSCRLGLNEHQILQDQFAGKLQLLLVSAERRAKLESFFAKAHTEAGTPYTLRCVAEDTLLHRLFEHRLIPHVVWIKGSKVAAVTSADHLSRENVQAMLQGGFDAQQKKDLDADKPLFISEEIPTNSSYSLFLKGQIDGLGSGTMLRQEGETIRGRMISNSTLYDMYTTVGMNLITDFNARRLLIDVRNRDMFNPLNPSLNWRRENLYTYEIRLPEDQTDSLYCYMLADLNRNSAYQARVEEKKVDAYALKIRKGQVEKLKSKGGKKQNTLFYSDTPSFSGYPPQLLTLRLNELDFLKYPVLDETGYKDGIDVSFSKPPKNFEELQAALIASGLEIHPVKRKLPLLVIKDDL